MKARFFALAALVLGLASCQQEFNGAAPVGGEVDFQLSVAAPELGATRADDGDKQYGYDSAFGAIDYLCDEVDPYRTDWTEVNLRYTLEVYDADALDEAPVKDRMVKIVDKYEPVTFDLRLIPNREYRFVVFADFVLEKYTDETANDETQRDMGLRHTIGSTLQDITIKNDKINEECTDAYFASEDITITNSAAKNIVLRRPYGKVRVIATDLHELNLNVDPAYIIVTYEAAHRAAFNAVTGDISDTYETARYAHEYNEISKTDMTKHIYTGFDIDAYKKTNDKGETRNTHMTLFTDYILANTEQESIHFTMAVYDANKELIKETHFNTEIPVQRNHLTTIVGNVLTTATEINVTIDDNFAGNYNLNLWDGSVKEPKVVGGAYAIYEAAELAWVAQQVNDKTNPNTFKGETIKLCKDIHLNGEAWTPIGATGKFEGTFDGQNHVIEGLFVNMTDKTPAGLFANAKYVKNLKVCHAEILGHYKAGVIVGDGLCSRIDKCHVENAVVTIVPLNKDDANHAGGIVGYLSAENEAWVKDCSVKNSTIIGYRDVAGIAGTANRAAVVVTGNTVENVVVIADQTNEYKERKIANVDAIAGRVTTGATIENNSAINADVYVLVNDVENLQYQIENATRDIKVVLAGNVVGNATIKQREGINFIVAGAKENTFNGVFTVNGDARANGAETLKFEGINFRTEKEDITFISAPSKIDGKYNYSHNVTIENCTFEANQTVGCANFTGTYNFSMQNCSANNVHSIAQLQSIDNTATISDVTVTNSKNGISFGNTKFAVLENATIDVNGYGVRADGAVERATSIRIVNSSIKAYIPVTVRNMTADAVNVTVALEGENTVVRTGDTWDVAFCYNEYEEGTEPVEPLGVCDITGADNLKVYPRDTFIRIYDINQFAEYKDGSVYKIETGRYRLMDDIELDGRIDIQAGNDVLLHLNGKTLTSTSDYIFIIREGANVTIDGNGTVHSDGTQVVFYPAGNLTINSGTFICDTNDGTAGQMFVGTKPAGGWESTKVVINGGYFDSGYYDANAANIEELLAGTMTLEETADDVKKRGVAGDKNKVRVALKNNVQNLLNRSNNDFKIYGGTFVGANPAWGDEGGQLPTTPNYLRPWSYYQGAFLDGQTFNENGIVLPDGYAITKSTHEDGRPIYTVTYNK